ncbi:MAG TPA: hypothetical protein VFO82_08385, partial [Steroidobacteraceae bacterium]|nr:hypothetical protein [Steroidobacteraceae bacterium]
VLARLALPGVTRIESITGIGGSSQRMLVSTGGAASIPGGVISTAGDLYVADFGTGSVEQVNAPGGPPLLPGFVMSPDGRYVFTVFFGDVHGYALANPGVPITFWSSATRGESADLVMPAPTSTGRSVLIVTGISPGTGQAIWELPPDDPAAAREVARYGKAWTPVPGPMIAGIDRLLVASDDGALHFSAIREIRISTGELLSTLTPPGGLYQLVAIQPLGADGFLVRYEEPVSPAVFRGRIGILRTSNPGTLTDVAPELDLTGALLSPGDRDGTAFGLTTVTAGVFTPYLVDVNLPAHPFPFSFGVAAGERANVALVFLPPDN